MWLPGHFAVAFLICFPLILYSRNDKWVALAYVSFFSVFPDFIHFGSLREISHSLFGLAIMLVIALVILWALFRPRPIMLLIGAIAAPAHLLGDLYIGSINPYFPFNNMIFQFHEFNSLFDITFEVALMFMVGILFLVAFRPWGILRSVRTYTVAMRRNILLLIIPFGVMAMAEGGYFFLYSFRTYPMLRSLLLLDFLLIFLLTTFMVLSVLLASPAQEKGERAWGQSFH